MKSPERIFERLLWDSRLVVMGADIIIGILLICAAVYLNHYKIAYGH